MRPVAVTQSTRAVVQVLGLCRFSYLGMGGFKVMFDRALDERRGMLYDPARLDARIIWFEHVFLPAWREQSDPDFTMVILVSDDLPDPWISRLRALIAHLPQFQLVMRPPMDHREACADAMKPFLNPQAEVVAQFRLDDDDAAAVNYVETIRADYGLLRALFLETRGMAVDYTAGVVLEDAGGGLRAERRDQTFWGCGLTLYLPPGGKRQVLNYQHHKIWQNLPTILRHKPLMWVRGAHQTNDSTFRRPEGDLAADRAKMAQSLMERFRIDLDALDQALAAFHRARERTGWQSGGRADGKA